MNLKETMLCGDGEKKKKRKIANIFFAALEMSGDGLKGLQ